MKSQTIDNWGGVVLCGGKAIRMGGRNKAVIKVGDRKLLDIAISELASSLLLHFPSIHRYFRGLCARRLLRRAVLPMPVKNREIIGYMQHGQLRFFHLWKQPSLRIKYLPCIACIRILVHARFYFHLNGKANFITLTQMKTLLKLLIS